MELCAICRKELDMRQRIFNDPDTGDVAHDLCGLMRRNRKRCVEAKKVEKR